MNKNLITKQNTDLVLSKSKSTLSITSKILSGKTSLTSEVVEDWIKEIWSWADENELPNLIEKNYSTFEVLSKMESLIIEKCNNEYNINLTDEMALARIYGAIESNLDNIVNTIDFDINLPFLIAVNSHPVHFTMSFIKSNIEEIIYSAQSQKKLIHGIPRNKKGLLSLRCLTLELQGLKSIPIEVFNLTNLKELNIKGNRLCSKAGGVDSFDVLKGISKLINLERLYIAHSAISELSEDIGTLNMLTHLIIPQNTFLQKLPDTIINLKNLQILDIRKSYMLKVTKKQQRWLHKLRENGCEVYLDSDVVENSQNIDLVDERWMERLWAWADENNIPDLTWTEEEGYKNGGCWKNLPRTKNKLLSFTELNLEGKQITELPKEIGNLTSLTKLNLRTNQLTELPKEVGNLTRLTELDLSHNQLIELPKEIKNLENLIKFDLSVNTDLELTGDQKDWFLSSLAKVIRSGTNQVKFLL